MVVKPLALPLGAALALTLAPPPTAAQTPLRIELFQRCADLLDAQHPTFCLRTRGLEEGAVEVTLDGATLATERIERQDQLLRVTLDGDTPSGPLWLSQGGWQSNPVWASLRGSHVVAAGDEAIADNQDGVASYVDLISLIIEEEYDGLEEARRLAEKYGAEVVGQIPPLNTYQLRLPARDLDTRDALVLRLGSEVSVDAVVVEETNAEESIEREASAPPEAHDQEWAANRFLDAVNFYQRRLSREHGDVDTHPVRIGVIERNVDFDTPDFADYLGDCRTEATRTCVYAKDGDDPGGHGTTVAGILAAAWNEGGNSGFLRGLDSVGPGFDVIVDRDSDAGITANIAASVNLVEDGARLLNWSWGIHRVGTLDINGEEVDSLVRSGIAMDGYEELLEEFFLWLRREHPNVVVVNSAGNASSFSGRDDYRLPSSFVTDQLFVVGGHERSNEDVAVDDARYAIKREASNIDMRVDVTAAACVRGSTATEGEPGDTHCGTSYSTPLVTGLLAAMMSIDPTLTPAQLRILLRRSAMPIGEEFDFEPTDADDLTAPILPSERAHDLEHPDIGLSARLDMYKALDLTVQSLERAR